MRAGLRILEAIAELNEADPALALQVRVGINTGEAVVALGARPEQGEGIVTGDVVNTASRLQAAAPVDGIAVSEQTYRADRAGVRLRAARAGDGEGQGRAAGDLAAARAAGAVRLGRDPHAHDAAGRQGVGAAAGGRARSSGRRSSAPASWSRSSGSRGWARAALCAELFAYIEERPGLVRWRQGRCLPYGEGIAFWALGEIVKAECGILESDSPEEAAAKLERALPRGRSGRPWLRARLAPLVGVGGGAGVAGGIVHGLAAVLESLAGGRAGGAGVRGPALGRPGAARLPRAPGRLGGRRAAAGLVHGAAGALRAAPVLGGGAAQRDHDQPRPAYRRGDGRAWSGRCWSGRCCRRRRRAAAGAGGRQPAVRGGVRAPARRPRRAGRGGSRCRTRCRR